MKGHNPGHNPSALIQRALELFRQGNRAQALELAAPARPLVSANPDEQNALATLLTHMDEARQALPHYEMAIRHAPQNIRFRYNLAMAQRMCGELVAAESNLDQVLLARPGDSEAHYVRSGLRLQTTERNHVDELRGLLHSVRGQRPAVPLGFALAKELEDLGEYRESFTVLSEACRLYRASIRYDVGDDVAVLEKLRQTHTSTQLSSIQSQLSNSEATFIIGLPRSGTTLVERILGRHSQVYAAGELDAFQAVAIRAVARVAADESVSASARAAAMPPQPGMPTKLEFVNRLLQVDFAHLGQSYLAATRPRTGHTPRFTDKFPANYLYAGAIHAALPEARFIALRRNPMDSCFALYKTLFAAAYPFSYDLLDLGRYFVAWDRLMRHWEDTLGARLLTVDYEALVARPEAVTRRMLEHCGLPWEAQCLEFQSDAAAVSTASAAQVRQPLYGTSVGKWRHHAGELQPLLLHFEANSLSPLD